MFVCCVCVHVTTVSEERSDKFLKTQGCDMAGLIGRNGKGKYNLTK